MAKKNEEQRESKESGVGSKILTALIIMLILFIWLAILALLIKFDVGGLGSRTLRPILKDIPVINRILPAISEEEQAYENAYPYKSLAEAVERIKELEETTDKLMEENEDYAARQLEMQREIDNLQHYEEEWETYLKLKEEFDRNIVFGEKAPSTEEYIKWYETMNPKTAAAIYEELMTEKKYDTAIQEKADYLSKMKADAAAAILEEMTSDLDLVCDLLECMKQSQVTDILSKMDSLYSARIINHMAARDREILE
ncbi:MAG: hypothetical protein ACI4FZ_09485 [Lachnospiraceae bacterium]